MRAIPLLLISCLLAAQEPAQYPGRAEAVAAVEHAVAAHWKAVRDYVAKANLAPLAEIKDPRESEREEAMHIRAANKAREWLRVRAKDTPQPMDVKNTLGAIEQWERMVAQARLGGR